MNIIKVEKFINSFFYYKVLFVTQMLKKLSLAYHMQLKKKITRKSDKILYICIKAVLDSLE